MQIIVFSDFIPNSIDKEVTKNFDERGFWFNPLTMSSRTTP